MDGATIQNRVYFGYAKAAQRIGLAYDLYRPLSPTAPMANKVGTLMAALDSGPGYQFKAPNEYGDPTWFALINDATTQPGDYLVGPGGTYFVAGKQFLLPVIVVECNRIVHLSRIPAQAAVGVGAYSTGAPAAAADVLTGWPASILLGGRGESTGTGLPSASKNVGWKILLPPSVTQTVNAGDLIIDDLQRRYVVQGAEYTDLGWRISAVEEHA